MQSLRELEDENQRLKDLLTQQSKMATMGEMISNITHQWRQPLMEVASLLLNMEAKIKLTNTISNEDILDTIDKSNDVLKYMSQTIDDFRNFFTTDKTKDNFFISEQIELAINMMRSSIKSNSIKVNIIIKNNIKVYGCKNEYLQVLINILSNAKDAIIAKNIDNGTITIRILKKGKFNILEIQNNGDIIKTKPIDKIFEPFYTKDKKNGTGIGLFMSKLIIENNMTGKLSVENKKDGVCFRIIL
ncbi:MAG: HAMP domain-containing sensor histidine kinase [Campylobacterota bacterium]|nr:HAMP domain-containing sensor histidine kinase [Campylobacterota bacterium]